MEKVAALIGKELSAEELKENQIEGLSLSDALRHMKKRIDDCRLEILKYNDEIIPTLKSDIEN